MCGERGERVNHLVSECSKLAKRKHNKRHDDVARYIHTGNSVIKGSSWNDQKPEVAVENENIKLLRDVTTM